MRKDLTSDLYILQTARGGDKPGQGKVDDAGVYMRHLAVGHGLRWPA